MTAAKKISKDLSIVEEFADFDFFKTFPKDLLVSLSEMTSIVNYPPGIEILKQGQKNNILYFLISGTAGVYVDGGLVAEIEGNGGLLGEMSVIADQPCGATACAISALSNVSESTTCSCSAGTCTVGVTGTAEYSGSAGFNYTVTAGGNTSVATAASLTINNVDDAPVASNITPAAFNEEAASTISLVYNDVESDQATSCSVSSLTGVTETTTCSCAAGACSVGVTGITNFDGAAGFSYTVTANGKTSAAATANFTINNLPDLPVANDISPAAFNEDTEGTITLSYSDGDGDLATACALSNLSADITETSGCSCSAGTCTVGVTGSVEYSGAASFDFTVTANGDTTTPVGTATLSISAVDDKPVGDVLTPATFDEDTESVISLTYSDQENDLATACSLSSLSGVTISTACTCVTGNCSVGVTGTSNYNGAASFNYTVTANSNTSLAKAATFTINAVNDAPALDTNAGITANKSAITTITNSELDASDAEDAAAAVTYTVKAVPGNGNKLQKSAVDLAVSDTFTQADINNSLITYVNNQGTVTTDSFQFSVKDSSTTYAVGATDGSPATFSINVIDGSFCSTHLSDTAYNQSGGNGTSGTPYRICTKAQIADIGANGCHESESAACGKYFILERDIDLSGQTLSMIGHVENEFTGEFDGNGKVLSNATYSYSGETVGFFGLVGVGGVIKDLGLTGVNATLGDNSGGLVGILEGTVERSFLTGSVDGGANTGGLVGNAIGGVIRNSYVQASVSSSEKVGGLVGTAETGTLIDKCWFSGTVTGDKAAGIVSVDDPATGANTYSFNYWVGGPTVPWDGGTSGGVAGEAERKNDTEMKTQSTFSGWDFSTIWQINAGVDYPRMIFEP
ncbi:cyclic nucleotide-binding domain-containing protein [bacterium]|nr:cyclic nucleotide-binding domain-containing protein [bacterium]